jgi:hypothetical protein
MVPNPASVFGTGDIGLFGSGVSQLSADDILAALAITHRLSAALASAPFLVPPAGRPIGTQSLSVVIWEARNQATHWDEVRRRELTDCFETLAREVDTRYGEYRERSLAFDVVELFGWRTIDSFNANLASMG